MNLSKIVGQAVIIESVASTFRAGSESVCLTLLVDGVGTVLVSFRPERGGGVWVNARVRRLRK